MKRKIAVLLLIVSVIFVSGCTKDNMEDIEIITTVYPLEFVTSEIYGEHALVNSIYPDGTNITDYKITNKKMNDFSKMNLFIYNGLSNDKDLTIKLLEKNKDLKIIDATSLLEVNNGVEELWLNPSNLLMISTIIKNGLNEYVTNSYLKKEIEQNYQNLKIELSKLDAEFKVTYENANTKTIVVANNALKFLEKYGFNVISLDERYEVSNTTLNEVKSLIEEGNVNYIFTLEYDKENEHVKELTTSTTVETLTYRKLDNIKDEERDNNDNYITLMNENINLLKKELYQ